MNCVIQRVRSAAVTVGDRVTGKIGQGLLLLIGVADGDGEAEADAMAKKIANLRIFCDENDKMNLSLLQIGGAALAVSNFTLCADCSHGNRPSFTSACLPERANELYERFMAQLRINGVADVQRGEFGADMNVALENDGPITIVLNSSDIMKRVK
jgi:D-tyrosyl-tRNA(Tyr) deacylase